MTPNKEYRKVFGEKPTLIGWRKPRSLKDHLVSVKIECEPSSDNKSALFAGLDVKFFLLLRKLKLFKTRLKVKHLTLERDFEL